MWPWGGIAKASARSWTCCWRAAHWPTRAHRKSRRAGNGRPPSRSSRTTPVLWIDGARARRRLPRRRVNDEIDMSKLLIVLFLVTPLAIACKGDDKTKKAPPATPVRVATAALIDAPMNVLASGVVEPVQTVAVTAQVSGTLLDVAFKEGDFVQQGQV